jgi:hypothetical protein
MTIVSPAPAPGRLLGGSVAPAKLPTTSSPLAILTMTFCDVDKHQDAQAIPSLAYSVLECGVCMENFEESGDLCPHVLACGHSFCCKDLRNLLLVTSDSFRCPTCLKKSKLRQYDDSFPPKNHGMLKAIAFEKFNMLGEVAPLEGKLDKNILYWSHHCICCNAVLY